MAEVHCEERAQGLKHAAMRTLFTRGLRAEAQKETEIGPVPESWEIAAIGDVALNTQYGLSVRGGPSGTYPILRMNCQEDGGFTTGICSSLILIRQLSRHSGSNPAIYSSIARIASSW